MIIDIHIGESKNYTISYKILDNEVSKTFYNIIKQSNGIILNRENFWGSNYDCEKKLDEVVCELHGLGIIDSISTSDKNKLHTYFPKYEKLYRDNDKVYTLLQQFNDLIHQSETDNKNVGFCFSTDDNEYELPETAYSMFELPVSKTLYMNYPHVGKHFFEIFLDEDYDIPKEQFVPTSRIGAGLFVPLNKKQYNKLSMFLFRLSMKKFYNKMKEKIQYSWKDKRLTIGYLPVGTLMNELDDVIENVTKYQYVYGWDCR
ncbi:hypothetical protein [Alteromonas sp.]|uniref:hypothetical protein n=1 Tax=Alteromonas sp. TaxID=232 RepID=UPI000B75523C|nr:hypothetical protein [Alteromonas sp.]MAI37456.1 hypothetical protein [Alteromonas sp.]